MPDNENNAQIRSPDYLSEIIKAISNSPPPGDAAQGSKSADNVGTQSANAGGDLLSSLLSNPELMTKLPSIISAVKPIMEMMSAQNQAKSESSPAFAQTQALPVLARKSEEDSRTALLCAMKPYLSSDRRQAIDYIVKLGRLSDILKTL